MNDRMTVARDALTKAAAAFREYETHHRERAKAAGQMGADDGANESMAKAQRNAALATECEMAVNLLVAQ